MAKVTLKFWDKGLIGGWTAAVVVDGTQHAVPPKVVGDGHGAGTYAAFDNQQEARQHALAYARRLLREGV